MTVNKVLLTEYENRLAQADAALQDKLKRMEEAEPVLKEKESELKVIEDQITLKFAQLMEPEKPPEKTFNVLFDDGSTGLFSEAELDSVETISNEQYEMLTSLLSGDSASTPAPAPSLDWKLPYQPSKATNKQLADDWRLFVAAIANLNAGKDEPFTYKDIYTWATECLKEIAKRVKAGSMKFTISKEKSASYQKLWNAVSKKVNYKSLDSSEYPKLIILVSPHAELVSTGKKTLIVKSRDYSGECDKMLGYTAGSLVFGTLKMKPPRKVGKDKLDELYSQHRVTPEEIEEWWHNVNEFYLYDIYDVAPYDSPRHVEIPPGPQTFVKNYKFTDAKSEQDAEGYMKSPSDDKKWLGMIQFDSRKKNVGIDFRWQVSDSEIAAFTVFVPKGLSRVPEDPADAKKILTKEILPLVKENIADPLKKLNCQPKENISATKDVFKEMVGYGPGYDKKRFMWTLDTFEVEHGCKKPDFVELFCDNNFINGRIIFVKIPNKAEWKKTPEGDYTWMLFKTKTETPYVLSTRAVKKKFVPPHKASALPRNIRNKVPERFQYWKEKDEKKRLKIRDELVEVIKKGLVKLDAIKKGKNKA